ncbi:MAG: hypothetical protein A2X49_03535 [Lentisphaerae bacterium GWF2_52_8]|nr:MAG: hypothetical protein A2X49_03535 [Lentisphaerae bacterium GWF2_52_8]
MSFKTALIGFGAVAAGFASDPRNAKHYECATHAQALKSHRAFNWEAVVDLSAEARETARRDWGIKHVYGSIGEMTRHYQPEIAVIATPPGHRMEMVDALPELKALMVEKPLGISLSEGRRFAELCERRGILAQVNLWRRADEFCRGLASGKLEELVGKPQAVFVLYGNGLLNNGAHLLDFVRMLFGEVQEVESASLVPILALVIPGDVHCRFTLVMQSGLAVHFQPLDFAHYRENAVEIWGTKGRLSIVQEGLLNLCCKLAPHRALSGEREIALDSGVLSIPPTAGYAFHRIYDNLAGALGGGAPLWSPVSNALATEEVLHEVLKKSRAVKD